MGALKIDKKLEETIQENENEIVDLFGDLEKVCKIRNSHLSVDKAKQKLDEVSKLSDKIKALVKVQVKLLEKWDAS
jgi:hypothetical protein